MVTVPGVSGVIRSFRPFAVASDVGTVAEVDVVAGQAGELGGPQPGLDGEQDPGVVAASGAG